MADIWGIIEALVGQKLSQQGKSKWEDERYFERLPKGRTNVEATPLNYIDPAQQVTVIPDDKWLETYGYAGGVHSPLGGIQVPSRVLDARMQLPMVLAHENFHARDKGGREEVLTKVAEALAAARGLMPVGITGQKGTDELMAQMVGAESVMPAGMRPLQHPVLRKYFSPEAKAAYIGRRYPLPQGVDALTGVPE